MKGNCGECYRRWYCEINPDDCNEWPDPVPMTNADSIRSMTDEELAEFLAEIEYRRSGFGGGAKWKDAAHALIWIQQPAENPNEV